MKTDEVPQDSGMLDGHRELRYAVDKDGCYTMVSSQGWEVVQIANGQAWQALQKEIEIARKQAQYGLVSPLAYYMTRQQMDVALLASYTRLWRWQVRRHLRPVVFKSLKLSLLERYAQVLGVTTDELKQVFPMLEPLGIFYRENI